MRKHLLHCRLARATAFVLAHVVALSPELALASDGIAPPLPADLAPAGAIQPPMTPVFEGPPPVLTRENVVVNRTVPKTRKPPLEPSFSENPTDAEVFKARVFGEPLVPIGRRSSVLENRQLAAAVKSHLGRKRTEDVTPYEAFLAANPDSPWRASILTNLGIVYRSHGAYTKALAAWQQAWDLAKEETDPLAGAVADRALGELAYWSIHFGRDEFVESLLAEAEGRDIHGAAQQKVVRAREGVWFLRNHHEKAIPSGPVAIERLLARNGRPEGHAALGEFHATPEGASLTEIRDLASTAGLPLQMAMRVGGDLPVPSIVHLKLRHFAAVVKREGDRFLLDDPILGGETWIGRETLLDEASGYFLLPAGSLPAGWRQVGDDEGRQPRGKCLPVYPQPPAPDPNGTGPGGPGMPGGNSPCAGMAQYDAHMHSVSLWLTDVPLGYSPPRGPAVRFHLSYAQREEHQPQLFTYSNFGPKWTFDWLSYVEDDPGNPSASANVYSRGGGFETFTGFDAATQSYALRKRDFLRLVRTASSPIRYERWAPDGSVGVYSQPDGAATFPRRVFLTQSKDPQGNSVTLTYDASLRIVAIADALGQVTTLSYDHPTDALKITKITDPFGNFATFAYNTAGQLYRITDTIGLTSEFAYDTGDFIKSLTTPYGTTSFEGGSSGANRWLQITDPLGARRRIEYQVSSTLPYTDPAGTVPTGVQLSNVAMNAYTTYYWDERAMALYPGDVTKAQVTQWTIAPDVAQLTSVPSSTKKPLENRVWHAFPGQTYAQKLASSYQPNAMARVLDDGTSQVYRFEFDPQTGNKTRESDPLGRTTLYIYAANGIDLLEIRQARGQTTDLLSSSTYDTQHRPLTVTDASGQTTTYTYNAAGQVASVTTPPRAGITENRTTTYTYNASGYLQTVTSPGNVTTSYTYDGFGRLRTVTDQENYTVTYDYDALDRPTRTTYPDGSYEQTTYNRLDPELRRDRMGRWTRTSYDALRRVVSVQDPAGRVVTQQWCDCGSLDRLTDANGNATSWERDFQGRVTKEIRANGSFKTFLYETTGSRLKKVTDAKGQEIQYTYALDNKLLQTTYANEEHATPDGTFAYDATHGRLITMTDGTGATTYNYHPIAGSASPGAGQLASVDGPLTNDTVSYTYDELGRVVSRTLNAVTTSWVYDEEGRLTPLSDPIGNFDYAYVNESARVQTVTYPNGQTSTYAYLGLTQDLRLQTIHHKKPNLSTLNKFDYTYDVLGNIKTWMQQTDANPAQTYSFEYDRADQLTAASLAAATPKRYRYAYDPAGNRTAEQIDDVVTGASYDNMNRLTSQQPGGAILFRGTTDEFAKVTVQTKPAVTPDSIAFSGPAAVGSGQTDVEVKATDYASPTPNTRANIYRVTQSGLSSAYSYDPNGNLTADGTKTYEWDANNKLTAVKQGAATLASFTYDGNGRRATKAAGGVTITYVYDGAQFLEERPSAGATKRYVYSLGIDRPLAQSVGGTASYFVADHLGSVVRTTDTLGSPSFTREYDPWGNLLQGSTTSGYAYTGREWDAEIGLAYLRARYYDARAGRFLGADPIGLQGGINNYVYTANNPLNAIDPFGTRSIAFTGCEVWFMDDECNIEKKCKAGSGKHGSKVSDQDKSWYGPTPEGEYTIIPTEFSSGWFRAAGWGKWRAPLHPGASTNTYGRENFFLHGDTRGDYASAGCIDIGACDTWARDWAMKKPDTPIDVYVQYIGGVCN